MKRVSQERGAVPDESNGSGTVYEVFQAPNGLEIFQYAGVETKYVYQEIFEERVYFRHGISLTSGDSVFDIGANIGLFTIFVKENFEGVKVHAFEPSPAIFRVLKQNVARYGDSVSTYACGIAGRSGEAKFTFYPHYSIMSGFHAERDQDRETLRAGIRSRLREENFDPADIQDPSLDRMVNIALGKKQEQICPLRTVSDIVQEAGVAAIGLLKIDAEGSELDILAGIRDEHWGRVRQIVMEVHDAKGTGCAEARRLLEGRGYSCVFEQEKQLSGSGIVNCYAQRG
jgi:FkbM family methyltransferase